MPAVVKEAWREGWFALRRSLGGDVNLSPRGRWITGLQVSGLARGRRRLDAWLAANPSWNPDPPRKPIFIVGLPRTGTTLLHNLLASVPEARGPLAWEVLRPAPPCAPGSIEARLRASKAALTLAALSAAAPDLKVIHPIAAMDLEECYPLLNQTFLSPAFVFHFGVPGYARWLEGVGRAAEMDAYRTYRTLLQVLEEGQHGRRWVLKSAVHLYFLGLMAEVFPDAIVIRTHRDPREAVASTCSMVAAFRSLIHTDLCLDHLGPECVDLLGRLLARGRLSERRVIDVEYSELVADPIGTTRRLCLDADLPWNRIALERARAWLEGHPQHRHGMHVYDLRRFGLADQDVSHLV